MPADRSGSPPWQVPSDLARSDGGRAAAKPAHPDDPGPRRPPRPPRPDADGSSDDRPRRFGLRNTVVDRGSERATAGPVDRTVAAPSRDRPARDGNRPDRTSESPRPSAPSAQGVRPAAKTGRARTIDATHGARRGRRVRRVVRRIDLWSVLKLSLVLYACMYAAIMATLVALWGLAYSSGSIEKLQSFLGDVGLENFNFYGARMFKAALAIGGVGVITATVATVLATALVNVISEITGGIRVVVIEEDVAPR